MPVRVLVPLGLGPSLPLSLPQQEYPNLNHVARGLGLGETPLEDVGRTLYGDVKRERR